MSAAEKEERAGSASLRQHESASRAERRRQLSAPEQAAVRAADNAARANKRERKRNRRDEDETAASLQHSDAKQRRSGSPAKVCSAEHATFIPVLSGFNEAFAVKVNVLVGQELSDDDEDKRKRDEEAAEVELLQQRSSSAQQQRCEDTPAPFVVQVLLCAPYATFLSSFFLFQ